MVLYQQGAPIDLPWSKKCHVANGGALTDLPWYKKRHATIGTVPTGGPNLGVGHLPGEPILWWTSIISEMIKCTRDPHIWWPSIIYLTLLGPAYLSVSKDRGLVGVRVSILCGNALLWIDLPNSKGFMKFGCLEPSKIMFDFGNIL